MCAVYKGNHHMICVHWSRVDSTEKTICIVAFNFLGPLCLKADVAWHCDIGLENSSAFYSAFKCSIMHWLWFRHIDKEDSTLNWRNVCSDFAASWTCLCRIKAPPAHGFDVNPILSPILGKSVLSPDQPEAIALDLCKSVQKLHDLGNTVIHRKMVV